MAAVGHGCVYNKRGRRIVHDLMQIAGCAASSWSVIVDARRTDGEVPCEGGSRREV